MNAEPDAKPSDRPSDRPSDWPIDLETFEWLRSRARRLGARPDRTWNATALVNQAYLRVAQNVERPQDSLRARALLAKAMPRILIDEYRAKHTAKRGGGRHRQTLFDVVPALSPEPLDQLILSEVLERLAQRDPRHADVVLLRVFGGMTNAEIADQLDVSVRTVEDDWAFARRWVLREMSRTKDPEA